MKRYEEVIEYVRRQIQTSVWPVGYKLPREVDLCEQLQVSRTTIAHAFKQLVDEGLLKRVKGTGTFVRHQQMFENTSIYINSFFQELRARGINVVTEIIEFHPLSHPDAALLEKLMLPEGSEVYVLSRLRYAENGFYTGPIVLSTTYFSGAIGRIVYKHDLTKESLTNIFNANNLYRPFMKKRISAVALQGREQRLLGAQPEDLALFICSASRTRDGKVVEYSESYYPIDRNEFYIDVNAD